MSGSNQGHHLNKLCRTSHQILPATFQGNRLSGSVEEDF